VLKVIEDDQARDLVKRAEVIEIVEAAYRAAADGQADVSHPSAMMMRGKSGSDTHFKVKGAILDDLNVAGFRLIADGEKTSDPGSAFLYVVNAETGRPLGMVSEAWLHRIRTASTGLVTCRKLLPAGAKRMALVGTGRIAEEVIRSCHEILPQLEIVLTSRSTERAVAAAERWKSLTPNALTAAPIREALADADVVMTLSDAAEVMFEASDLRPGALVCAMGGRYEFNSDVLDASAVFIVDELDFVCAVGSAAYWIKTGQVTRGHLADRLDATIGELLKGTKSVERGRQTLAIIQGMAVCDLAIAKTVLDRAETK
jgi:ornithine cyclodeaminase/alanine dehydrogenase-like protein (mu-crystallin family)